MTGIDLEYLIRMEVFIGTGDRAVAEHIGHATLVEYPGVGHMTAIRAPELLVGDLAGFFARYPV